MMLGGPRTLSGRFGDETYLLFLLGTEPLFLGPGQKPNRYTDYSVYVIVGLLAVHVSAVGCCV
jgi:hypothetical protein